MMTDAEKIQELEKKVNELEKAIENQQKKRSGFLTAAGIIAIVASCILALPGLLFLIAGFEYIGDPYMGNYYVLEITSGIVAISGFSLGLMAGIFTLYRKKVLVILSGLICLASLSIISFDILPVGSKISLIYPAIPFVVLALISLVFVIVARKNFKVDN